MPGQQRKQAHHVGLRQVGTLQHLACHFFGLRLITGSCQVTTTHREGLRTVLCTGGKIRQMPK